MKKIAVDADKFYIDKLENYYYQKNNSITRYDKNFKQIATYDNKSFGDIACVDVSNPFKILVFYNEINRLVYLDNYFAELRTPIRLDDLGFFTSNAVCSSSQGGFWIYDNQAAQVVLVDADLLKTQQGVNLFSVVKSSSVKSMLESNSFLFLLFESEQLVILDKFGNFYKNFDNLNIKYFDVLNDIAYLVCDKNLEIYNVETGEFFTYLLPDIDIEGFQVSLENMIFLSNKNIIYFKLNN
ncbi:hypothetical protein LJC11_01325 [Bacteroidales bacterium OttesenSCG-928-I21]|nr:hypothetical protein [Bacteroidales bacterium OttesenSCG-928-I21]